MKCQRSEYSHPEKNTKGQKTKFPPGLLVPMVEIPFCIPVQNTKAQNTMGSNTENQTFECGIAALVPLQAG
jgi:hypothetical protein